MYQPDSLPIAAVSGDPIFDVHRWLRLSHHGIPIYLYPEGPHWFVPSRGGDALLQQLRQNRPVSLTAEAVGFLQRLPQPPVAAYAGRAACLQLDSLQELAAHHQPLQFALSTLSVCFRGGQRRRTALGPSVSAH